MIIKDTIIEWLLNSDPSIKWQVQKYLLGYRKGDYQIERDKIGVFGWGKEILDQQNKDGLWNNSAYNGKWISTTYALYMLKTLGLDINNEKAQYGCRRLIEIGIYDNNEIRFSTKKDKRDIGVHALVVASCVYFNLPKNEIISFINLLLCIQNEDGSWFYSNENGSEKYSFETTLLVLEALSQYNKVYVDEKIQRSIKKGEEYLLKHNLYQKNGMPIKKEWVSFPYPNYWFYDALTAMDYFARNNKKYDSRMDDCFELVTSKLINDKIKRYPSHSGKTLIEIDKNDGIEKWNTLRYYRVKKWKMHLTNAST